jgi:hypothetical protein
MPEKIISAADIVVTPGLIKPTASDTSGATPPENSEIRKIAEDILSAAKYSFVSVAANPEQEVRAGTLEAAFKEGLEKMGKDRKDRVVKKAAELAKLPESARMEMFGRYGKMDTKSFIAQGFERAHEALPPLVIDTKILGVRTPSIAVASGITLRATPEGILLPRENLPAEPEEFLAEMVESGKKAAESELASADMLSEIWGPVFSEDPYKSMMQVEEFEETAVTDKLAFHITRIKCVDETNPEWWGSDEIALAGVSVDETGDTKKIGERYIGGGFDDGDQKGYSPYWRYDWFSMREGQYWPKHYNVSLILAEKDYGGLSSVLNTVWQRVRDRVKAAIEQAVTGALTGYLGPVIAAAIGKAVAWIIDVLVGWIIRAFQDDIFPPFTASVNVPSFYARWYYSNGTWGCPTSPLRLGHFYGHGGHYLAEYYWMLYA